MQLITAARLVDGTGAPAISDAAILVSDAGRIEYAGPRSAAPAVPGAHHLDLAQRTILPGIVDGHVHFVFDGVQDLAAAVDGVNDTDLLGAMSERAERMLRSGVTCARELGARGGLDLLLKQAITEGRVRGPRLVVAGSPLTVEQGHCHFLGGAVQHGRENVQAAAEHWLDRGVDWIKMMVSGGTMTPATRMVDVPFDRDEIRGAAQAAHARGKRLAAHAHPTAAIVEAVAGGADSIEHCTWLSPEDTFAIDPLVAERMAGEGIYACNITNSIMARVQARRGEAAMNKRCGDIGAMHDLGVRIAFGSDSGIPGAVHDGWAEGLAWLVRAGMSPLETIRSATQVSADCIGMGAQVGTLESGKWADIIAVPGNPVADIAALAGVDWVMQGGQTVVAAQDTAAFG